MEKIINVLDYFLIAIFAILPILSFFLVYVDPECGGAMFFIVTIGSIWWLSGRFC